MRGTGCSGGAFGFFEPLQSLDGYDVIETVAHQPWVLHHRVGMMGISYGGISQLFVAATDPPDLAAIAPLSVIDNSRDHALPGRDPQHRLRRAVGGGARLRRRARVARPAGVGAAAHPRRGPDLPGQPGAARRGGQPARQGAGQPLLRAVGGEPARPRSPSCTRSMCRCSSPASGPTSRPAVTAPSSPSTSPGPTEVVHVHQRRPHRLTGSRPPRRWYDFL